jgi:hypothetical protein
MALGARQLSKRAEYRHSREHNRLKRKSMGRMAESQPEIEAEQQRFPRQQSEYQYRYCCCNDYLAQSILRVRVIEVD